MERACFDSRLSISVNAATLAPSASNARCLLLPVATRWSLLSCFVDGVAPPKGRLPPYGAAWCRIRMQVRSTGRMDQVSSDHAQRSPCRRPNSVEPPQEVRQPGDDSCAWSTKQWRFEFRFPGRAQLTQAATHGRMVRVSVRASHRKKWTGAGLNRRHTDFQSVALPTELPVQNIKITEIPIHRSTSDAANR